MVDFMNFENYSCDNQMSIFDFTREPISITKPIRLIELFAGYGSQAMALKRIGAKFEHYRVVEFDKYAIASYNAVHGTDFPTMDITKVHAEDLNICGTETFTYLLTYSFPCTDLSVAGKQGGMSKGSGTRSGLLWEVERILTEIRDSNGELPQILFMENVPQVHSQDNMPDFIKWLDFLESLGYTNYYQDLNAKNYGRFCLFCRSVAKKDTPFCQLFLTYLPWHTVCLIKDVRLVHEKKKKNFCEPFAGKSV